MNVRNNVFECFPDNLLCFAFVLFCLSILRMHLCGVNYFIGYTQGRNCALFRFGIYIHIVAVRQLLIIYIFILIDTATSML